MKEKQCTAEMSFGGELWHSELWKLGWTGMSYCKNNKSRNSNLQMILLG